MKSTFCGFSLFSKLQCTFPREKKLRLCYIKYMSGFSLIKPVKVQVFHFNRWAWLCRSRHIFASQFEGFCLSIPVDYPVLHFSK